MAPGRMAFGPQLAFVAAFAVCLTLSACGEDTRHPAEEATAGDVSAEAATVNGQTIYVADVELEAKLKGVIKPGEQLEPGSAEFDDILEELIEVKLLAMEALQRGLDEDPEARHRLDTARDNILGNILIEHVAAEEIDEAAVRKMYEAQVQLLEPQMENEARVRHIMAPTKEAIDKIAAELKTGVDFAVLAARRSTDEATRLDGGDLGYMTADEASPEFARVIREVPEGGVSRPFEDQEGWHIVKVDQLRKRRPPSLEDLRDTIERYLKSQQLEKILKQLRGEAESVKRNPARASGMDKPAARPAPAPAADPVLETTSPVAPDAAAVLPATPGATTPATTAPATVAPKVTPPASAPKPATVTPAKPAPATPSP
ncbi:MAG: peptidylprolyl isomerase [Hyphomonadaceae bacterium]